MYAFSAQTRRGVAKDLHTSVWRRTACECVCVCVNEWARFPRGLLSACWLCACESAFVCVTLDKYTQSVLKRALRTSSICNVCVFMLSTAFLYYAHTHERCASERTCFMSSLRMSRETQFRDSRESQIMVILVHQIDSVSEKFLISISIIAGTRIQNNMKMRWHYICLWFYDCCKSYTL